METLECSVCRKKLIIGDPDKEVECDAWIYDCKYYCKQHFDIKNMSNCMQTFTGKIVNPYQLTADSICIDDIAHALSNICRFCGHCNRFYSVAEHSIYVSQNCHWNKEEALWGLLHDASEAYIHDIVTCLKSKFTGYRSLENKIMKVICLKFGLPEQMPDRVREADMRMLSTEKEQLMTGSYKDWGLEYEPLPIKLFCYSPKIAEERFMCKYHSIKSWN